MSNEVSDKDLKKAFEVAAKVVAKYGETYLPIFERLEQEYQSRKETKKVLERALTIADETSD